MPVGEHVVGQAGQARESPCLGSGELDLSGGSLRVCREPLGQDDFPMENRLGGCARAGRLRDTRSPGARQNRGHHAHPGGAGSSEEGPRGKVPSLPHRVQDTCCRCDVTADMGLGHPAEVTSASFLHREGTLPFHVQPFGRKSLSAAHTWEVGGRSRSPSLRVGST